MSGDQRAFRQRGWHKPKPPPAKPPRGATERSARKPAFETNMAGVPGLEPRTTEPETAVLPITPYPKALNRSSCRGSSLRDAGPSAKPAAARARRDAAYAPPRMLRCPQHADAGTRHPRVLDIELGRRRIARCCARAARLPGPAHAAAPRSAGAPRGRAHDVQCPEHADAKAWHPRVLDSELGGAPTRRARLRTCGRSARRRAALPRGAERASARRSVSRTRGCQGVASACLGH